MAQGNAYLLRSFADAFRIDYIALHDGHLRGLLAEHNGV